MKEKFTALFLAMALALGLSACDGTDQKNNVTNDNSVMGEEHANPSQNGKNDYTTNHTTGTTKNNGTMDSRSTNNTQRSSNNNWNQMLQNGRVHDTDGILTNDTTGK